MPNDGFILDGTNPLDQALRALDDTFARRLNDLKEQLAHNKKLLTAMSSVSEIDAKAAERYDLTVIMPMDVQAYEHSEKVGCVAVEVGGSRARMDWFFMYDEEDHRPRLKPGRYAVVVGLKRIGDL